MFERDHKLYVRFLKDNGIYVRVMQLYKNAMLKSSQHKIVNLTEWLSTTRRPDAWLSLDRLVGKWSDLEEGGYYWSYHSLKWKAQYYFETENVHKLNSLNRILKVVAFNDYYNGGELTWYANKVKELLKESELKYEELCKKKKQEEYCS